MKKIQKNLALAGATIGFISGSFLCLKIIEQLDSDVETHKKDNELKKFLDFLVAFGTGAFFGSWLGAYFGYAIGSIVNNICNNNQEHQITQDQEHQITQACEKTPLLQEHIININNEENLLDLQNPQPSTSKSLQM